MNAVSEKLGLYYCMNNLSAHDLSKCMHYYACVSKYFRSTKKQYGMCHNLFIFVCQ